MARSDCPVHAAAIESRRGNNTVALLSKVGVLSPTCTCGVCWLCDTARHVVRTHGTREGNEWWVKLWNSHYVELPE